MKPEARQFYRTATTALNHARLHTNGDGEMDSAQVILSIDFAVEMLLKAALLERGESILEKPGRSLSMRDALKKLGRFRHGPSIEILHERRNNLQHFAGYSGESTVEEMYESALSFFTEVLQADFGTSLGSEFGSPRPASTSAVPWSEIHHSTELQRDIDLSNGVIVWAEGEAAGGTLGVHCSIREGLVRRLTPSDSFEYLPKIDGQRVVTYRQSGGIVLYDIEEGTREVISESGAPTSICAGKVACQGVGLSGGIGGGVWLYDLEGGSWELVSESGDSAILSSHRILWQELAGDVLMIRERSIGGGEATTLVTGGGHPTMSGGLFAWTDWATSAPEAHVHDFGGAEHLRIGPAVLPFLSGQLLGFLRPRGNSHDLVVVEVETGAFVLEIPEVGFPTGRGPVLSDGYVYFESSAPRGIHGLYRQRIQ